MSIYHLIRRLSNTTNEERGGLQEELVIIYSVPLTLFPPWVGAHLMWYCKSSLKLDVYCIGAVLFVKVRNILLPVSVCTEFEIDITN